MCGSGNLKLYAGSMKLEQASQFQKLREQNLVEQYESVWQRNKQLKKEWRTRGDSNSQPLAPEANALSIEPRVRKAKSTSTRFQFALERFLAAFESSLQIIHCCCFLFWSDLCVEVQRRPNICVT